MLPATPTPTDASIVPQLGGRYGGWRFWAVLAAIAGVALGMRLYKLSAPSFWEDELFTVRWCVALADGGRLGNRPLAYLLNTATLLATGVDLTAIDQSRFEGWMAGGIREWNLRLPVPFVAGLGVFLLGWAARRIMSPRAALILAGLMALSVWHLWMSQVARFYMQQFVFYNLALVVYFAASERRGRPAWTGLAAATALAACATMTQLTSMLIAAIFVLDYGVSVLLRRPAFGVPPWVAGVLGLVGAAAMAAAVWRLYQTYNPDDFTGSPQPTKVLVLGYAMMVGLPVAAAALLSAWWLLGRNPRLAIYLLLSTTVPVAVFVVLGLAGFDVHVRYTFVALFAWLALAAIGLDALIEAAEPRVGRVLAWSPVAAVLAGMVFNVYVYYGPGNGYRAKWREACAYIQKHRQPGEGLAGDYVGQVMTRYYLGEEGVSMFAKQPTEAELAKLPGRTWIVFRATEPAAGARASVLDRVADLRAYFNVQNVQPFHSVHVYLYDPATAPPVEAAKGDAPASR